MKCFYHPDKDAVAQCSVCSKGLCSECASKWDPPTCDGCGVSDYDIAVAKLKKIKKFAIIGLVCGLIGAIAMIAGLSKNGSFGSPAAGILVYAFAIVFVPAICSYALACIPVGWDVLNKLTSRIFLFLPIIGWVIYFFTKLMLSVVVGFYSLPFVVLKQKKIIKQYKNQ